MKTEKFLFCISDLVGWDTHTDIELLCEFIDEYDYKEEFKKFIWDRVLAIKAKEKKETNE